MHVLLLGGTGNLDLRMLPALLAYGHTVVAYVRSESKLRSLISSRLAERITIHVGDALDSKVVEAALRKHGCDAIMNTAGTRAPLFQEQYLHKIATSVSSAATRVGNDRGKPLRAWFIGGLTSLVYPFPGNLEGRRWQAQDFMPAWVVEHHRGTEMVLKKVSTVDLEWSLLCVAWMWPRLSEIDVLEGPRGNGLEVKSEEMVDWRGSWLGNLPVIGRFLDLLCCLSEYSTMLEDVADLVADDLASVERRFVGQMVGRKDRVKMTTA